MKDFIEANDLREMAQQIIDSEKDFVLIDLEKVEFCRIKQQTKQGEHLFAFVQRLSDLSRFICKKDWAIVFYPIFDTLTEKGKKYVVEHEIRHIDPENKKIINHDFAEFRSMVKKHGLDYLEMIENAEQKIKLIKETEKLQRKQQKLESKK